MENRSVPREPGFVAVALCPKDWVAVVALVAANLATLPLLIAAARIPTCLPGDARTHALAAAQLFDHGLVSGWIDGYSGGFPAAVHYPILGWLLIGLPARLGLEPATATRLVCTAALMGAPILLYLCARISRASIASSLLAALLFTWVSPLNPFVGGFEAFYMLGLVSQVLVIPMVILWVTNVLGRGTLAKASFWAGLCFLQHPQVSASASLLLGLVVVATVNRVRLMRFGASASFAALVAALTYGPGIRTMSIPFGWPELPRWMHLGFGPDRLGDWLLDGTLLDRGRAPIVTSLWALAFLGLPLAWRHPAARGAMVGSVGIVTQCTIGPALQASGPWGERILAVFQPLRAMALVPLVACVSLLVALELRGVAAAALRDKVHEILPHIPNFVGWVSGYRGRLKGRWLRHGCKWGGLGLGLVLAGELCMSRLRWFSLMGHAFDNVSVQRPCGPKGPSHDEIIELKRALSRLRDGRLWFEEGGGELPNLCAITSQIELASGVPIATTLAVGTHVGFASLVIRRLDTRGSGLSMRAEALGIRHLLLGEELSTEAAIGFELVGRFGPLRLYSRVGGTSTWGFGCVRSEWFGSDLALKRALAEGLTQAATARQLLAPERLIGVVTRGGDLSKQERIDDCSTVTAKFGNVNSTHSRHSAMVSSATPVDVVLRVTAYPSWTITIDGIRAEPKLVFPGYYAVRIPPGTHQVEARTRWSLLALLGFSLALLGPCLAGLVGTRTQSGRD